MITKKKKLLLLISTTSLATVVGVSILVSKGLGESSLYAENKNTLSGSYSLVLDSNNHLDTDDGGLTYFSYTSLPLHNKVYFDVDDTFEREPEDGWMSLVNGGTFNNPTVFNTSKIKGMKSIRIVSDYNNLKLHYGCEVDGEIVYSNYVEFNTTTTEYTFAIGHEPSYIKIEGYTGTNSNLLESVEIEYSCSESDITPTENLAYELIEGKEEYRILSFTNPKEDVPEDLVIPSYIDGHPVTEIGDDAFNGPSYLTIYGIKSITIPDTVKSIGDRAFMNCQKVTKINMPTSGIHIGDDAFLYCGDMETINITKDQVDIDLATYQASPVLKNINVEEGNPKYYSVDGVLYQYNYSDTYVSNQNTLLYCPCAKEGTITIPNDVTYIASSAFKNSKASIIRLGSSVAAISENFRTANYITDFEVESGNITYSSNNGLLCDYMGSILYSYPRGRASINVSLPNNIMEIGDCAFYDNDVVQTIYAPGVLTVGDEAFKNMDNVSSISLASLSTLGTSVFENDKSLTNIPLVNSVTKIPDNTFKGCTALSSFSFPLSLSEIGVSAFEGCTSLTDISFPIYQTAITLTIKSYAFKGCSHLGDISLEDHDNIVLQGHVFEDSGITSITFNNTMTSIPDSLCRNCDLLTYVTFPVNVKTIGYDAFNDCDTLSTVDFLDYGVTTINSKAFLNCNLHKVYLPESVTTIGASALNQGHLIEVYADISGLDNGDPFDFIKKPNWNENMCGAYYRLISGDRNYYEKQ